MGARGGAEGQQGPRLPAAHGPRLLQTSIRSLHLALQVEHLKGKDLPGAPRPGVSHTETLPQGRNGHTVLASKGGQQEPRAPGAKPGEGYPPQRQTPSFPRRQSCTGRARVPSSCPAGHPCRTAKVQVFHFQVVGPWWDGPGG